MEYVKSIVVPCILIIGGNTLHFATIPLLYLDIHPYFSFLWILISSFVLLAPIYFYLEFCTTIISKPSLSQYWKLIVFLAGSKSISMLFFYNNLVINHLFLFIKIIIFGLTIIYSIPLARLMINNKVKFGFEPLISMGLNFIGLLILTFPLMNQLLLDGNDVNFPEIIISLCIFLIGTCFYVIYNIIQKKFIKVRKYEILRNLYYDIFYITYWSTLVELFFCGLFIFTTLIPYFGTLQSIDQIPAMFESNILCILKINSTGLIDLTNSTFVSLTKNNCQISYVYIGVYIIGYIFSFLGHSLLNVKSINLSMLINSLSIPFIFAFLKVISYLDQIPYWSIFVAFCCIFISTFIWIYWEVKWKLLKQEIDRI